METAGNQAAARIIFFGTYDVARHPRVRVVIEGLTDLGHEVIECNVPLGLSTAWRVRILRRPWLLPVLIGHLVLAWTKLAWLRLRLPSPDAVVVGYLGHFDVLLARALFRKVPIALDHLIFAADTAVDRGVKRGARTALLRTIDNAALRAADVVVVDTSEHLALLPRGFRSKGVVVLVGAPSAWFEPPTERPVPPLRILFFGLYTPLQGAPTIGHALRMLLWTGTPIKVTMAGQGQDLEETRAAVGEHPAVAWREWVPPTELPRTAADHDVCLGIFGTTAKGQRVVPNKVFQGAAAGCVVVTSDTAPQRAAMGDAALYVPAGDPEALSGVLRDLAGSSELVKIYRHRAYERAQTHFRPVVAAAPLQNRLLEQPRRRGRDMLLHNRSARDRR